MMEDTFVIWFVDLNKTLCPNGRGLRTGPDVGVCARLTPFTFGVRNKGFLVKEPEVTKEPTTFQETMVNGFQRTRGTLKVIFTRTHFRLFPKVTN